MNVISVNVLNIKENKMNIAKENIVYELSSIGNIKYIDGNINITG